MIPKVSIVVPVYNVENYLEMCLDSLVNQTLKDIEIIIVNDGSTDQSAHIAEKYANKYNNIYLFHKKNEGLGEARNYGIKYVKGKYVTFVDSDDSLTLDACEKLSRIADEGNFDIVTGKSVWRNESEVVKPVEYYEQWFKKDLTKNFKDDLSFGADYVVVHGKLYLSSFIMNNGILFPKIIGEDVPFSFYTFYFANNIKLINEIVYIRTERQDINNKSITQQYNAKSIIDRIEGNRLIDEFCEEKSWEIMLEYYILHLNSINKLMLSIKDSFELNKAYSAFKSYIIQLDERKIQLTMKQLDIELMEFKEMGIEEYIFKQELRYEYILRKDWKELRNWCGELENSRNWLEQQLRNYQEEVTKQQDIINDLKQWTHDLEQAKIWLEEQLNKK